MDKVVSSIRHQNARLGNQREIDLRLSDDAVIGLAGHAEEMVDLAEKLVDN